MITDAIRHRLMTPKKKVITKKRNFLTFYGLITQFSMK